MSKLLDRCFVRELLVQDKKAQDRLRCFQDNNDKGYSTTRFDLRLIPGLSTNEGFLAAPANPICHICQACLHAVLSPLSGATTVCA